VYCARVRWIRRANLYPVFIGFLIELSEFSRRLSVEKLHEKANGPDFSGPNQSFTLYTIVLNGVYPAIARHPHREVLLQTVERKHADRV
jgi:hypothetical protein